MITIELFWVSQSVRVCVAGLLSRVWESGDRWDLKSRTVVVFLRGGDLEASEVQFVSGWSRVELERWKLKIP